MSPTAFAGDRGKSQCKIDQQKLLNLNKNKNKKIFKKINRSSKASGTSKDLHSFIQ